MWPWQIAGAIVYKDERRPETHLRGKFLTTVTSKSRPWTSKKCRIASGAPRRANIVKRFENQ